MDRKGTQPYIYIISILSQTPLLSSLAFLLKCNLLTWPGPLHNTPNIYRIPQVLSHMCWQTGLLLINDLKESIIFPTLLSLASGKDLLLRLLPTSTTHLRPDSMRSTRSKVLLTMPDKTVLRLSGNSMWTRLTCPLCRREWNPDANITLPWSCSDILEWPGLL